MPAGPAAALHSMTAGRHDLARQRFCAPSRDVCASPWPPILTCPAFAAGLQDKVVAPCWDMPEHTFGGQYARFMGSRGFLASGRPPCRWAPAWGLRCGQAGDVHTPELQGLLWVGRRGCSAPSPAAEQRCLPVLWRGLLAAWWATAHGVLARAQLPPGGTQSRTLLPAAGSKRRLSCAWRNTRCVWSLRLICVLHDVALALQAVVEP